LIDNIFVIFGGRVFQQTVGSAMGINRALMLADMFQYFFQSVFIPGLFKNNEKMLARIFTSSLAPPPRMEIERSSICVLDVSNLSLTTILIFDFGIVPMVYWYWCVEKNCSNF
jgi:hypothetical protein